MPISLDNEDAILARLASESDGPHRPVDPLRPSQWAWPSRWEAENGALLRNLPQRLTDDDRKAIRRVFETKRNVRS